MPSVIRGDDNFDSNTSIPSTAYDAVGTYALLHWINQTSTAPNTTVAGSNLYPASTWSASTTVGAYYSGSGTVSGTWRLMGSIGYYSGTTAINRIDFRGSVFVRIS